MTPPPFDASSGDDQIHGDATTDDRVLRLMLHSLPENDHRAIEKSLDSGDAVLLAAIKDWEQVVQELSLALPPVTPDPRILSSILTRIGTNEVPEGACETNTESSSADNSAATLPSKEGSRKSLVIRRADGRGWRSAGTAGTKMRILNFDRCQGRTTFLLQIDPGSTYPGHAHHADEECLVISGDIHEGDLSFGPGDYFLAPAGSEHGDLTTIEGCVCLITTAIPMNA